MVGRGAPAREWSGDAFVPFAEARAYGAHTAYRGELDDDNDFGDEPAEHVHQSPSRPVQQQNGNRRVETSPIPRLPSTPRPRLTSKQLAALIAISRKLGMDLAQFRQEVRSRYGTQIEFITNRRRPGAS
ncbi:hypothetical protein [Anaeromyxobacter oryzae]|uniref:Uncharacterized protein n=1 Tax=Anaeromyxobacter oryzae TaxID=2918170 RepID=A0ABM7WVQ0_9BACT|nr:hypothetical protein [Anaeromyxobacter oryzae]BDG03534.1 hypothetical protein AMOR_25300 [Anaeromyxobacter oryzae]